MLFTDKPKFLCEPEVFAKMNEPNYKLVCKVHANPEVMFARVSFVDPSDSNHTVDLLEGGAVSGDYRANVTVGVSSAQLIDWYQPSDIISNATAAVLS